MQADPFYDEFSRVEETFKAVLDESLNPRGPDMLYDLVGALGLAPGTRVLDLGCGKGRDSLELARRFGFRVHGVDPVPHHSQVANSALLEEQRELRDLVEFRQGSAESVPAPDASIDLVWCREVLYHIEDLDVAFAECHRVLRLGGRMVTSQTFGTPRLEPGEAVWWMSSRGVSTAVNARPEHAEAALARCRFRIDESVDLGSEWGERGQETTGEAGRRLLHAARLLRKPELYVQRFGQSAYDIMLGDCFWHIYRMLDKLSTRVYLLTAL
jgi:SAM-dependent methyltransferase